jgi:hypothetical protein
VNQEEISQLAGAVQLDSQTTGPFDAEDVDNLIRSQEQTDSQKASLRIVEGQPEDLQTVIKKIETSELGHINHKNFEPVDIVATRSDQNLMQKLENMPDTIELQDLIKNTHTRRQSNSK